MKVEFDFRDILQKVVMGNIISMFFPSGAPAAVKADPSCKIQVNKKIFIYICIRLIKGSPCIDRLEWMWLFERKWLKIMKFHWLSLLILCSSLMLSLCVDQSELNQLDVMLILTPCYSPPMKFLKEKTWGLNFLIFI